MKKCSKCGLEKPEEEFYVKRILKSGKIAYMSQCKACKKERDRTDERTNRIRETFIFNCY